MKVKVTLLMMMTGSARWRRWPSGDGGEVAGWSAGVMRQHPSKVPRGRTLRRGREAEAFGSAVPVRVPGAMGFGRSGSSYSYDLGVRSLVLHGRVLSAVAVG